MILAQRDKVRVLGIRKCGHTSIINTFLTNPDDPIPPGEHRPRVRNSGDKLAAINAYRGDGSNCQDWPVPDVEIAFIRDPVRRALSAYHHFIVRGAKDNGTLFRDNFNTLGFKPGMSFDDYVTHLESLDLGSDPHITSFSDSLVEAGIEDVPYCIAPLEMIDDCWPALMIQFNVNCPLTLTHANVGRYDPDDFLTVSNSVRLRELYSEDHKLWEFIFNEAREAFQTVSDQTH